MDLSRGRYFSKEPGCSFKNFFLFSKFKASGLDIDIDDLKEKNFRKN